MQNNVSYKHCLNCQTELHGNYCHVCGQKATNAKPTIKEFILEYLNIAFVWDTHFLKTIRQVVSRPGHVTKEYISGKFVSYTHPLKLNMFLLFVFITLFLIFHKDLGNSIHTITRDEANYPLFQLQLLTGNAEYAELLKASPFDTVQIYAPLMLADEFPDIIKPLDAIESTTSDTLLLWTAALPHILIEDEVITIQNGGHYTFNDDDKTGVVGTEFLENIWSQMVKIFTTYFPVFILLTVPFLAFLLNITQKKGGHSKLKHFVFSLHYTAFLELLIILLYIISLIASPPIEIMQWVMILGAGTYLTMAIRKVYETKTWFRAAVQAIFINSGYVVTLAMLCFTIFIISLIIVSIRLFA